LSFPIHMTQWLPPRMGDIDYTPLTAIEQVRYSLFDELPPKRTVDAYTRATPLDAVKEGLREQRSFQEMSATSLIGTFGGLGWEWVSSFVAFGGLYLLYAGIIRWQIPVATLAGIAVPAMLLHMVDPERFASAAFHLFSGAAMLGAFFIATDPVSASTTDRGRLIFGAGVGLLTYAIRTWGGYPDGVAFAVLLMNAAVPLIDRFSRPRSDAHAERSRRETARVRRAGRRRGGGARDRQLRGEPRAHRGERAGTAAREPRERARPKAAGARPRADAPHGHGPRAARNGRPGRRLRDHGRERASRGRDPRADGTRRLQRAHSAPRRLVAGRRADRRPRAEPPRDAGLGRRGRAAQGGLDPAVRPQVDRRSARGALGRRERRRGLPGAHRRDDHAARDRQSRAQRAGILRAPSRRAIRCGRARRGRDDRLSA